MAFGGESPLLLFESAETRRVHLGEGVDVVGAPQLCDDFHDEFALALKLGSVDQLLLGKLAASLVGVLRLFDLAKSRLDDLVLEQDALLQLLSCLSQSLFRRPIVPLVVCTLLVQLQLQSSGDVPLQGQYIKVGVFFHKVGQS